jgi:Cell division control protein 14, SIN component
MILHDVYIVNTINEIALNHRITTSTTGCFETMDSQISKSFQLLNESKLSEALRELDGLLYSLCKITPDTEKRSQSIRGGSTRRIGNANMSAQLYGRKETREFIRLQDCYIYNITGHLMEYLLKTTRGEEDITDDELVLCLEILQGACLLHYQSRQVFCSDASMEFLISSLESSKSSKVQIALINTVVSVMVREVYNIRKFEQLKGLAVICNLFKNKETAKDVKLRILEFLFFYLIPETRAHVKNGTNTKQHGQRTERKTTEEKQALLGRYLSNVSGLVRELNMSRPFGDMDLEW